ncbi:MAG: SHOCT domain-containing protein [Chloroflexi bacterium]|nr:MAG: SHOCT domain-containing protein [Chloroflexota bacterium]
MMWHWGSGYGWGMAVFGVLMMLVFWGGIAVVIVVLVRSLGGSRPAATDRAMETLRQRLASGEITSEEFERLRKVLQG